MDKCMKKIESIIKNDYRLRNVRGELKYTKKYSYKNGKKSYIEIMHIVYFTSSNNWFENTESITIKLEENDIFIERMYTEPFLKKFKKTEINIIINFLIKEILKKILMKKKES